MKIIFLKQGEYKNDDSNIVVTAGDIEKEKVYSVVEKNAVPYIKKGLARLENEIKADKKPEKFESDTAKKPTVKAKK